MERSSLLAFLFGALSLAALGCGGAENDPCQQPDDCGSGLICCSSTGTELTGSTASFGACQAAGTCSPAADAGADSSSDSGTAGCQLGISGSCPAGQFCSAESCSATTGTCLAIPGECPAVLAPVCGCSVPRQTFLNVCEAQRASVVSEAGECTDAGTVDSGTPDSAVGDGGVDGAASDASADASMDAPG